jgi:hypothetical protein
MQHGQVSQWTIAPALPCSELLRSTLRHNGHHCCQLSHRCQSSYGVLSHNVPHIGQGLGGPAVRWHLADVSCAAYHLGLHTKDTLPSTGCLPAGKKIISPSSLSNSPGTQTAGPWGVLCKLATNSYAHSTMQQLQTQQYGRHAVARRYVHVLGPWSPNASPADHTAAVAEEQEMLSQW